MNVDDLTFVQEEDKRFKSSAPVIMHSRHYLVFFPLSKMM